MLCSRGYLLERREQLDADKPEFVAPDVFEQEGVVLQVFIGQVVLDLGHQLLDELWIRRLPALLLQLPAAGPGAAVCVGKTTTCVRSSGDSSRSTSLNVSCPELPKTTTVTHFTPINTIRQRAYKLLAGAHRHPAIPPSAILPAAADERLQSPCRCARPRHQRPASPKTAKTSPSEGRGVTGSPSHTEYGGPSNQSHTETGTNTDLS